jgi:hypothetical protein
LFRVAMTRARDRAAAEEAAQGVTALSERWKAWLRFQIADI